jgi:outer membrane murein-binding lipoprotein Lpp
LDCKFCLSLPAQHPLTTLVSIDATQDQDEIDSSLQSRLTATIRLVSGFADAAAGGKSSSFGGDLQQQLARLQAEASTLRASSSQLQAQVDQLRQSRDSNLRDLQRAEKRLDRQRMEFDKERGEWTKLREAQGTPPVSSSSKPVANGSGHSTPNARADAAVKPEPVDPGESTSILPPPDTERIQELERIARKRDEQLKALRAEHLGATQELDKLKVLVSISL